MSHRIMLVDDEPDILEFLGYNLRREGYEVLTAQDGPSAIESAPGFAPHLIVLDMMMPGMDGIETCRRLRAIPQLQQTMITFLSARGEDESQIAGLDAGADNYITKPVRVPVLLSHIKAMLRGSDGDTASEAAAPRSILVDTERYVVIKDGEQMILPRKEFNLLNLLYSKPMKVFTREEIYNAVWGTDVIVGDRTIDVHIRKLREKIGDEHIVTIKGVGYKYMD